MASEIKDLSNNYKSVNSTYASIKNLSKSNTQLILEYQLNSESPPSELSSLVFSEYSINNQIDSKVGNTKTAYSQLQSINKSLQAMSPSAPLLPEITRAFDSGIVIIAILLVFYLRLNRKHHIHAKPDAKHWLSFMNWPSVEYVEDMLTPFLLLLSARQTFQPQDLQAGAPDRMTISRSP